MDDLILARGQVRNHTTLTSNLLLIEHMITSGTIRCRDALAYHLTQKQRVHLFGGTSCMAMAGQGRRRRRKI
jgi:hypothetical protein